MIQALTKVPPAGWSVWRCYLLDNEPYFTPASSGLSLEDAAIIGSRLLRNGAAVYLQNPELPGEKISVMQAFQFLAATEQADGPYGCMDPRD